MIVKREMEQRQNGVIDLLVVGRHHQISGEQYGDLYASAFVPATADGSPACPTRSRIRPRRERLPQITRHTLVEPEARRVSAITTARAPIFYGGIHSLLSRLLPAPFGTELDMERSAERPNRRSQNWQAWPEPRIASPLH
ncbi:hypothetical protein JQ628_24130 [Bradyrhizobium lablabi]|uniref:hypothetical protein n=1 Tax=Bradyrhizobium lablabi TaxID=722472 RepID=UPI001BA8280C|nr:hypothetical protein [Bradyrhizobium lablabi]MBR1124634.1 hypothetical protein [Bradyrhizobium lablabi]